MRPLLPMKPLVFEIMLVLRDADMHGYGIVKALSDRELPGPKLFPASLYRTLRWMRRHGLVEEVDAPGGEDVGDERRRYFRLTERGVELAKAEARRLEEQVAAARERRLLPDGGAG